MGFFSIFKGKDEEEELDEVLENPSPEPVMPENAYFGREPILDKKRLLVGFDLFFRMDTEKHADRINAIALRRYELIAAGALPEEIAEKDLNPDSYLPPEDEEAPLQELGDSGALGDTKKISAEDNSTEGLDDSALQGDEKDLSEEDGLENAIESDLNTEDLELATREIPPEPFVKISEIMRALREHGVANSLGRQVGFFKVNKQILMDRKLRNLNAKKFAFELPFALLADHEVVKECESLNRVKYQLVLNDFDQLFEGCDEILPLFKFVKLDLDEANHDNLKAIIDKCHELEIKAIAKNVNTPEAFNQAKDLGFDLFEGYFFAHSNPETSLHRDDKHLKLLKLLTLLLSNPELSALDAELSQNPTVAKHLIKIAEIEGKRKQRKVENVRDAVVLSGIKRITRWTQLLLYADSSAGVPLDTLPLLQMVCVRAFYMENAAGRLGAGGGLGSTDLAFLTGGLSLVEVLFDKPSREILQEFDLPHAVVDAISDRTGFLGKLLLMAEAAEMGDQEKILALGVDELAPLTMQTVADDSLLAIRNFVQQTQEEPGEDEWPDAVVEEPEAAE